MNRLSYPVAKGARFNRICSSVCFCIFTLVITLSFVANPVMAEPGDTWRSKGAQGYLHKSPSGARVGSVYTNMTLKEVERKGSWVKVQVDAWLPATSLKPASSKASKRKAGVVSKSSANELKLTLKDFHVERRGDFSGEDKKAVLKLDLTNREEKAISAWEALLIVKAKETGKVLFRYPVTGDNRTIAPGKTESFLFGWGSDSEEYHQLLSFPDPKKAISLKLVRMRKPK